MEPLNIAAEEFDALLLASTPFIDVRSEIEFAHGSIPGAVNLPILDTREREQIGLCYKTRGQQAAIELGHELVSGALKVQRIERWCAFARTYPDAILYCWRGGLRSRLATQWMAAAGHPVPLVEGGFKALRRRLLAELAAPSPREPLYVIGGRTGSAKTDLVNSLPGGVDLEGFARHRGSSFGRRADAPPAQIDFENALALAQLRQRHARPRAPMFLEDESRQIGAMSIPLDLYQAMRTAPLVIVEMPLDFRIGQILRDYIGADMAVYRQRDPQGGFARFGEQLLASLGRIARRLGDERFRVARQLMQEALDQQSCGGDDAAHRAWIELLLREYYDPMYEYQLQKSSARVVCRGEYDAVREWCLNTARHAPR